MMEISKTDATEEMSKTGRGTFLKEVRCAVRFPLSLPVEMADDKLHDHPAVTRNVSANGVLLELTGPLDVGEELDFHLRERESSLSHRGPVFGLFRRQSAAIILCSNA